MHAGQSYLSPTNDMVAVRPGRDAATLSPKATAEDAAARVLLDRLAEGHTTAFWDLWAIYRPHRDPQLRLHGLEPAIFELIDRHCLAAINDWKHMGLPEDAAVLLLAQTDVPEPAGEAQAEAIRAEFAAASATETIMSTDPVEAEALFAARRLVFQALERRGDPILTEDVCVPRGRLAEMLTRVEEIGARHDTFIANAAHAGDGNLHPLLITPRGDEAARKRAQAAFAEIIDVALDMGGTVTGEHGIGLLKIDGMRKELGPVVVGMQRAVKQALDPQGILNPGKSVG